MSRQELRTVCWSTGSVVHRRESMLHVAFVNAACVEVTLAHFALQETSMRKSGAAPSQWTPECHEIERYGRDALCS